MQCSQVQPIRITLILFIEYYRVMHVDDYFGECKCRSMSASYFYGGFTSPLALNINIWWNIYPSLYKQNFATWYEIKLLSHTTMLLCIINKLLYKVLRSGIDTNLDRSTWESLDIKQRNWNTISNTIVFCMIIAFIFWVIGILRERKTFFINICDFSF